MKRLANYAVWLGIALCCIFLSAPMASPALAQEVGLGLICNEPKQAEKYVAYADSAASSTEALSEVNGNTAVCGVVMVAYVRGPTVAQARNRQGTFDVVEITVIGANLGMGLRPVPPFKQFTVFKVKEEPT